MEEKIINFVFWAAPIAANCIAAIIVPWFVKKFAIKKLQKKINEVNQGQQLKEIKQELADIKKEILEMRGKIK